MESSPLFCTAFSLFRLGFLGAFFYGFSTVCLARKFSFSGHSEAQCPRVLQIKHRFLLLLLLGWFCWGFFGEISGAQCPRSPQVKHGLVFLVSLAVFAAVLFLVLILISLTFLLRVCRIFGYILTGFTKFAIVGDVYQIVEELVQSGH